MTQGKSQPPVDAAAFNRFEAAGWETKAETYDSFFGQLTSKTIDRLLDAAGVGAGTRVLDVATGPGYAAATAAERGASVDGVDVAPAMVAHAKARVPAGEFHVADAENLPYANESFEAVVANFGILHFGRPERAVSEMARVLRPGGRVALTAWDQPDRMRLLAVFLDALADAGATPPESIPVGPPFFRFADDDAFSALLRQAGLVDVRVERVAFDHAVPSGDHLWDGFMTGTVRTSSLIEGQSAETRRRVRAAFDAALTAYRSGDGYVLPVSVKLASGRS